MEVSRVVLQHARLPLLSLAAVMGLSFMPHPQAQDVPVLRGPTCSECRIVLQRLFTLGTMDGPQAVTQNAVIVSLDGEFALASSYEPGEIRRFDRTGRYLGAFGGRGQGPGEQERIHRMRVLGDTLYVLDTFAGRINRYDASGHFLGLVRVRPYLFDFVPLGDERFFLSGIIRTRAAVGYHLSDGSTLVSSFGTATPTLVPGMERALLRVVGPKAGGEIWSAHQMEYIIESWDDRGRRTAAFRRDVTWFPKWDVVHTAAQVRRPSPSVQGLVQDAAGLLWVSVSVTDANWRPVPLGLSGPGHKYAVHREGRGARRARRDDEGIAALFRGGATQPCGMQRPSNAGVFMTRTT